MPARRKTVESVQRFAATLKEEQIPRSTKCVTIDGLLVIRYKYLEYHHIMQAMSARKITPATRVTNQFTHNRADSLDLGLVLVEAAGVFGDVLAAAEGFAVMVALSDVDFVFSFSKALWGPPTA